MQAMPEQKEGRNHRNSPILRIRISESETFSSMLRGRSLRICLAVLLRSQRNIANIATDIAPKQTEKTVVKMVNGNIKIEQGHLRGSQSSRHNNMVVRLGLVRIMMKLEATIKVIHYSISNPLVAGLKVHHLNSNPIMHLFKAIAAHQRKMVRPRLGLRKG